VEPCVGPTGSSHCVRRTPGGDRYALADGERELAVLDGKGWGKRPVKVTLDGADKVEAGLLLFAVFIVRGLAAETSAVAGSAAAAATGP